MPKSINDVSLALKTELEKLFSIVNKKAPLTDAEVAEFNHLVNAIQALRQEDATCKNVDILDKESNTALIYAACYGHSACVTVLLAAGANPNYINPETGSSALIFAAQNGHMACVKALLAADANPNYINPKTGNSALLFAAQNDHMACVEALLAADANPNYINPKTGSSALIFAAQDGRMACVEALLAAGANPNYINPKIGSSALRLAAQDGHTNCVKALLAADANPNCIHPETGVSTLILAAKNGHMACVEALLATGANPNYINPKTGNSALLLAAQNGHTPCVEALLAAGANPNYIDPKTGDNALLLAVKYSRLECICALAVSGVDASKNDLGIHKDLFEKTRREQITSAKMIKMRLQEAFVDKLKNIPTSQYHSAETIFLKALDAAINRQQVKKALDQYFVARGSFFTRRNIKGPTRTELGYLKELLDATTENDVIVIKSIFAPGPVVSVPVAADLKADAKDVKVTNRKIVASTATAAAGTETVGPAQLPNSSAPPADAKANSAAAVKPQKVVLAGVASVNPGIKKHDYKAEAAETAMGIELQELNGLLKQPVSATTTAVAILTSGSSGSLVFQSAAAEVVSDIKKDEPVVQSAIKSNFV